LLASHAFGALLMVRRARWLLLSLFLIYAFASPGDGMFPALGSFSPSLQGALGGAMQAWRLILLLLALGLLLRACPQNSLLSGIYILIRPFGVLGIDADRIAVRLWLTLQYAEQQPRHNIQGWWNELRSTLDPSPDAASEITLELPAYSWRDGFILALAVLLLGLALW
jgi:energy-coupling factor transport system permease protein